MNWPGSKSRRFCRTSPPPDRGHIEDTEEEIAREVLELDRLMPSEYDDKPLRAAVFRSSMADFAPTLARAYLELLEDRG